MLPQTWEGAAADEFSSSLISLLQHFNVQLIVYTSYLFSSKYTMLEYEESSPQHKQQCSSVLNMGALKAALLGS